MENLNSKVQKATKWSALSELCAKLILPITNMILARLLAPEMFGVVATVTMIVSLADLFTDAGFQKYLVQREFNNDEEKNNCTTVAFWSNLIMSFFLLCMIFFFRDVIADAVGNPGLGNVLFVASISLPLTSFSSIQSARFKRDFDFKTLFYARWISLLTPIFITIPLAVLTRSYWALICGTLAQNLLNAVFLTIKSPWKPRLYFNMSLLRGMLSFSIWTTVEQISIWLTSYADVFIVGMVLSQYYVGIYRTSMTTVNAITSVIISATTPVLFASLSRLQNNNIAFNKMFLSFQRKVGYILVPLSAGILLYSPLIVKILLGSQWSEANGFVGLWGCLSSVTILFSHYCSEVYRAKGKPKLSFVVQILHLIIVIPVVMITSKHGFECLYVGRSLVRLELILVNLIIMKKTINISIMKMVINVKNSFIATIVMSIISIGLQNISDLVVWQVVSIIICTIVYFSVLLLFRNVRKDIMPIFERINIKNILNRN